MTHKSHKPTIDMEWDGLLPAPLPGPSLTVGRVRFDVKCSIIVFLGGMLPIIRHYHRIPAFLYGKGWLPEHFNHGVVGDGWNQTILFLFIPLLVVMLGFRENPARYGFRIGRWKEGVIWTAVVCPLILAAMLLIAWKSGEMRTYYLRIFYSQIPQSGDSFFDVSAHLTMFYYSCLLIIPWEYLWRGFFLFGLAPVTGPGAAIWLQAIPFALLHIGKPELETLTTMIGGMGFGFVAWRTQSFLYAMLIHLFMLVALNLCVYAFIVW